MRGCIVVPYRDRASHLVEFMDIVGGYGLDIVVIEQERGVLFNRAKLFNVFYREFGGLYDYYIFHDVDMIPEVVDYGYHDGVCHLAGRVEQFGFQMPYPTYLGGVTMFSRGIFEELGGYPNGYYGWGAEDDFMYHRVIAHGLGIEWRPCVFRSLPHERVLSSVAYANNVAMLGFGGGFDGGYSGCSYDIISRVSDKHIIVSV